MIILKIFIPFIHKEFNVDFVRDLLFHRNYGYVTHIDMFEKKRKKVTELKSLNHYFAFLEICPNMNSFVGKRFYLNVLQNKNTPVILNVRKDKYFILKPYLDVKDRITKGYSMIQTTPSIYDDYPNLSNYFDDPWEKREIERDFELMEKEIFDTVFSF